MFGWFRPILKICGRDGRLTRATPTAQGLWFRKLINSQFSERANVDKASGKNRKTRERSFDTQQTLTDVSLTVRMHNLHFPAQLKTS